MSEAASRPSALPQEIIRRKRDGAALAPEEIERFVAGLADGAIGGEQTAAFAMAVFLRGMDRAETVALTRAMTLSGTVLDWRAAHLGGPVLDKHSTGGVGDHISLVLAPALAACGAFVPMISGRGLGHTGGTLDKLEAIPGFRTALAVSEVQAAVREVGCAIVGATADLAPADAKLYAVRDVTATVESIPLITASILSKKRAAGLDALVMDVKTGSGAFMTGLDAARALARSIVEVAGGAGLPATALVTDMDQPLADAAGNAVEVRHALRILKGELYDPRVQAVVDALGAEALVLGGLAEDAAEGRRRIEAALRSGRAAERFAAMVARQDGPSDLLERTAAHLPQAPVRRDVSAESRGFVASIDTRLVGMAVVGLGGGRTRPGERIDASVGFEGLAPIGTPVGPGGRPLGTVWARTANAAEVAGALLRRAYRVFDSPPQARPPVIERIGADALGADALGADALGADALGAEARA